MRRAPDSIWKFVAPVVTNLDYEFVGASLGQAESGLTLRVYIDAENGVTVDDCAIVSRQLGDALDVENLIAGEYCLEVSSPGLDRPLFGIDDFTRFTGSEIKLKMAVAQQGRRNYRGLLDSVVDQSVVLEVDGEQHQLRISDIESASIVARF
jgi:ribosome maturation factor RimP